MLRQLPKIRIALLIAALAVGLPALPAQESSDSGIQRTSATGTIANSTKSHPELSAPAQRPGQRTNITGRLKPQARKPESSSASLDKISKPASGQWMTTLLGLTIVLGLILSCAYAFRKHIPFAVKILPPDVIEVLGRRFIDQRNCIQLIRCGNRILIVAHSPTHGLQTLGEICDPIEIDSIAGQCRQNESHSTSNRFEELVSSQLRPAQGKVPAGDQLASPLRTPRSSGMREQPHA